MAANHVFFGMPTTLVRPQSPALSADPSPCEPAVRLVIKLRDCSTAKKSDPYLNNRVAQLCGLIVGVFIIIPPLIRLADGRWATDDWVLFILGILLTVTWLVIITLGWRQRRRERAELRQLRSD